MRSDLVKAGYSEQLQHVEQAVTTQAVWAARPGAAREDVLSTWTQLVALHRQWHSLLRELKDAELALGAEASETNYGWLRDVKARLAEVDGIEALIEGFGESSGRFQRSSCGLPKATLLRMVPGQTAKRLAKPMVWLQKQG